MLGIDSSIDIKYLKESAPCFKIFGGASLPAIMRGLYTLCIYEVARAVESLSLVNTMRLSDLYHSLTW